MKWQYLYKKILQSNISSKLKDEGEILSLIEVDCEKIEFLFFIELELLQLQLEYLYQWIYYLGYLNLIFFMAF